MRKIASWLLIGLGAFLLVVALLGSLWAPGQVEKTPLDTNSYTYLSGSATALPTGDSGEVKAVSVTKADAESDDEVVVFLSYTCLVLADSDAKCGEEGVGDDADPAVVSVGEPELFATDRHTGVSIADASGYLPEGFENTEGLVNKFPFGAERKTYQFWDGLLGQTVPAEFQGTKDIHGVETYEFSYSIADAEVEIASGVDGTYSMDKTMWIDPVTGAIIDQEQHDVRSSGETTLLDVNLSFTDAQVRNNAADADENIGSLKLVTSTVPLVGYILGPIMIVVGIALLVLGRGAAGRRASGVPADS